MLGWSGGVKLLGGLQQRYNPVGSTLLSRLSGAQAQKNKRRGSTSKKLASHQLERARPISDLFRACVTTLAAKDHVRAILQECELVAEQLMRDKEDRTEKKLRCCHTGKPTMDHHEAPCGIACFTSWTLHKSESLMEHSSTLPCRR